ncbi:MAG: glutathione transferase [Elainellaceae cyanobacterium]
MRSMTKDTLPHITLFVDQQFASPYAMSAFVTLVEKGISFEVEKVDLDASHNQEPPYRDRSLTARVPTLAHNDFFLSESTAIAEYLEEVFPFPDYPSVFPGTITDRARARQIQAWLRSDLMPLREERTTEVIFFQPTSSPLSEAGRQAAAKLIRVADSLLTEQQPNLFEQWCIADTDLALMLNRLVLNGDEVPEKLRRYATLQWQRPAVQQWVQQERSSLS